MKLIVGLGNPGGEYAQTRHNVGFMVVDELAASLGVRAEKKQHKALLGQVNIGPEKVILAKPQTFMNLSGQSVVALMNWYKLALEDLLVIVDDMDLPPGTLRIRKNGSAGGQRGLQNIIELLGTQDFARMRVGIGRSAYGSVGHVLGKISEEEAKSIGPAIETAVEAVRVWVLEGTSVVMNRYNKKAKTKKKEEEQVEAQGSSQVE
ncbi:aminoacyl-tRNA hydrolase [Desulfotomaculum sp. 1211_IL3151]|uniref:aminoacyl-tRNA hydrolase n=1 Tax=Desulfotomaculum sp. 1211_IL3151 TaxID=3084055 RepID=UPI002FDAC7AF